MSIFFSKYNKCKSILSDDITNNLLKKKPNIINKLVILDNNTCNILNNSQLSINRNHIIIKNSDIIISDGLNSGSELELQFYEQSPYELNVMDFVLFIGDKVYYPDKYVNTPVTGSENHPTTYVSNLKQYNTNFVVINPNEYDRTYSNNQNMHQIESNLDSSSGYQLFKNNGEWLQINLTDIISLKGLVMRVGSVKNDSGTGNVSYPIFSITTSTDGVSWVTTSANDYHMTVGILPDEIQQTVEFSNTVTAKYCRVTCIDGKGHYNISICVGLLTEMLFAQIIRKNNDGTVAINSINPATLAHTNSRVLENQLIAAIKTDAITFLNNLEISELYGLFINNLWNPTPPINIINGKITMDYQTFKNNILIIYRGKLSIKFDDICIREIGTGIYTLSDIPLERFFYYTISSIKLKKYPPYKTGI